MDDIYLKVVFALCLGATVGGATAAEAADNDVSVAWEEVLGSPVEPPERTLADRLAGHLDDGQVPDGVLGVIGEYRGGNRPRIVDADLSSDGEHLLIAEDLERIQVWRLSDRERVANWKIEESPKRVRYSPEDDYAAVVSGFGANRLTLWDAETGEKQWRHVFEVAEGSPPSIEPLAFSPDGRHLVGSTNRGTLRVWSTADGSVVRRVEETGRGATAFGPEGRWLAVAGGHDHLRRQPPDGSVVISSGPGAEVEFESRLIGREQTPPERISVPATGARFAEVDPAGNRVLFDGWVGTSTQRRDRHRAFVLRELDNKGGAKVLEVPTTSSLSLSNPTLTDMEVSGDGGYLAGLFQGDLERGGDGNVVAVYRLDSGERVSLAHEERLVETIRIPEHCGVAGIMFDDASRRLVTALVPSTGGWCPQRIRVRGTDDWSLRDAFRLNAFPAPARWVAFGGWGGRIRLRRRGGTFEVYRLPEGRRMRQFEQITAAARSFGLTHGGRARRLAGGKVAAVPEFGRSGFPRHWTFSAIDSGRPVAFERLEEAGAGPPVAFSEDLRAVVTAECVECKRGRRKLRFEVWRAGRAEPIALPLPDGSPFRSGVNVAMSADGSRVVAFVVRQDAPLIWDITDDRARLRRGPAIRTGSTWRLSPDGSVLAEPTRDGSVLLWDLRPRP
jgi:WD40 repeat protein